MLINKNHPIPFTFEGQPVTGYAGDTVASALYRWGLRTFSRGLKYHRPRGIDTLDSSSYTTIMRIDGVANERASRRLIEPGMVVERQNVDHNLRQQLETAVTHHFDGHLPAGFHYKSAAETPLRQAFEALQKQAGGMSAIDPDPAAWFAAAPPRFDKHYLHADLTIVGSGPSGMSAAIAAAGLGVDVLLIEEEATLGGSLRYRQAGLGVYADMVRKIDETPNIRVLAQATVFGVYRENFIGIVQKNRLFKLRTQQLVVCAGGLDQPLVFHNNDLPGSMLGSAARRLMHLYDVKPGETAVVLAGENAGWEIAQELQQFGVAVVAVADVRPAALHAGQTLLNLQAAGTTILPGHAVLKAHGSEQLTGVTLVELDEADQPLLGTEREFDCDLLVSATGQLANLALLEQAGIKNRYDRQLDDFLPQLDQQGRHGVWAAGRCAGTRELPARLLQGSLIGIKAALATGTVNLEARQMVMENIGLWESSLANMLAVERRSLIGRPLASIPSDGEMAFIDLAADATERQLKEGVAEGFNNIQMLKRYTTIAMGLDQGKTATRNFMQLLARETGQTVETVGRITTRPPFVPVKMGVLAGRMLQPTRRTPLHGWHAKHGATFERTGNWLRPHFYGAARRSALNEVITVRERVGLIDVSTLGKLELHGPDVVPFLERLYTGRFKQLAQGKVRYAILCNEAGVLLDDGVVAHAANGRYILTTTSGGSGRIYEWFAWWNTVWGYDLHVVDQSGTLGAMNLSGPQARTLLTRLESDIDFSNTAFPYLGYREGRLLGVPIRVFRIGFVGELGYEIHAPASQARALWEALIDAGNEFGIAPFGLEAQRILRLEKGHLIIGQDTDGLSDPFGAGLGWAVKLGKADFIGKPSLQRLQANGSSEKLVGFVMDDPEQVPLEGDQIWEDGMFCGRITSARFSPTLQQAIGLCWLPADKARPGTRLHIRTAGRAAWGRVQATPFLDPNGVRLRR